MHLVSHVSRCRRSICPPWWTGLQRSREPLSWWTKTAASSPRWSITSAVTSRMSKGTTSKLTKGEGGTRNTEVQMNMVTLSVKHGTYSLKFDFGFQLWSSMDKENKSLEKYWCFQTFDCVNVVLFSSIVYFKCCMFILLSFQHFWWFFPSHFLSLPPFFNPSVFTPSFPSFHLEVFISFYLSFSFCCPSILSCFHLSFFHLPFLPSFVFVPCLFQTAMNSNWSFLLYN